MGIIDTVLALYDLSRDVLSLTSDSYTLTRAVQLAFQGQNMSAPKLFEVCVSKSLRRHSLRLAATGEPDSVVVDKVRLASAIETLDRSLLVGQHDDPAEVYTRVAREILPAISLRDSGMEPERIECELLVVVKAAFEDFFVRLPRFPVAAREIDASRQESNFDQLKTLFEKLVQRQDALTHESAYLNPATIQQESSRIQFRNPFRIVKAEEFDHDYHLLAQLFRAPMEYDQIRGPENIILEGGRGCGKSMILRSMSVLAAIRLAHLQRAGQDPSEQPLHFAASGLDYFGVYVKLARGYFYEWSSDCKLTQEAATQLSQHVLNVVLLSALIETVQEVRGAGLMDVSISAEKAVSAAIGQLLGIPHQPEMGFPVLQAALLDEQRHVRDFVGALRLGVTNPPYIGQNTSIHDFLDKCCSIVKRTIPDLRDVRIYFLLDEYENLATFQQTIVNTLAKLRPLSLSLKIAARPLGLKSVRDLQGEPIQRPRDYQIVELDYDGDEQRFRQLLLEISRKRLAAEGYRELNLAMLLEQAPPCHPATPGEVEDGVAKLLAARKIERSTLTHDQWNEYMHRLSEPMIYRVAAAANRKVLRTFAGLDDFTALSSGIVSNFLELCKMAFYLADASSIRVRNGEKITWAVQNEAVQLTSAQSLDWISHNIENTGPKLSRMAVDLAGIFHEKLLNHFSEPEAARVVITDPEELEKPEYAELKGVLFDGVRWSVLQTSKQSGSYSPKHSSDKRSVDYWLNRILAPILKISHNTRSRTTFTVARLMSLLTQRRVPRTPRKRKGRKKLKDDYRPLLRAKTLDEGVNE